MCTGLIHVLQAAEVTSIIEAQIVPEITLFFEGNADIALGCRSVTG